MAGMEATLGVIFGKIGTIAAFAGELVAFAAIFGGVAFWIAHMSKFRHKCTIIVRQGGQIKRIIEDKVREIVDDDGKVILQTLKTRSGKFKFRTPKPENKYCYAGKKGIHYFFEMDDNSNLQPMKIGVQQFLASFVSKKAKGEVSEINRYNYDMVNEKLFPIPIEASDSDRRAFLKIVPQDLQVWSYNEKKKNQDKFKKRDKLLALLQLIAPVATMAICFLIIYFAIKSTGAVCGGMAGALQDVARTCGL